jgi:hypothetical protein
MDTIYQFRVPGQVIRHVGRVVELNLGLPVCDGHPNGRRPEPADRNAHWRLFPCLYGRVLL